MTKFAMIPISEASSIIPNLLKKGIIDENARIYKSTKYKLAPILEGKECQIDYLGYKLTEGLTHSIDRIPPQKRILASLSDLPKSTLSELPLKWKHIGKVTIIKLKESAKPYERRIGTIYAKELGAKTICVDRGKIIGEFRKPNLEVIYGSETESMKRENGILYNFDVTKIMFSSGNTNERKRMKNFNYTGKTIVDMFAGIGYFTLPLAKFANPRKIVACEKNPDSYKFLVQNISLNNVENVVVPVFGDNRDLDGKSFADCVIMGYVQKTSKFIPKALDIIKSGGIIHYHDTFYVHEYEKKIKKIFDTFCPGGYKILKIEEVKSFAPAVSHYVADIQIY
ncbi:MAG: class I SAM-dependent methyltransferase family protein [archaeon]|nr:class I SAM-dependent methyltransferase family protein [archaeon]